MSDTPPESSLFRLSAMRGVLSLGTGKTNRLSFALSYDDFWEFAENPFRPSAFRDVVPHSALSSEKRPFLACGRATPAYFPPHPNDQFGFTGLA